MAEQIMNFQYKGSRDYIHGTDIFNETLAWLSGRKGEVRDIDFTFHRVAAKQLKLVPGPLPEGVEPVAACAFKSAEGREKAYLVETEQAVAGRYPYDEDEIVGAMAFDLDGRKATLRAQTGYSDIEVWVAMTKALHYKVFPQLEGKWLFVRGRFPAYERHTAAQERVLAIAASFNDKLTRSEAWQDGVKVGEIFFSIV
ncbi:MAG: hypothetical protein AB1591_11235 [Pseudomonadota bacterium]